MQAQVLEKIKDFVQGQLEFLDLQRYLAQNTAAEAVLRQAPAIPPYSHNDRDAYDFIIGLNAKSIDDCLSAQDMLSCLLSKNNIKYKATDKYEKINDLRSKAQPKWLYVDDTIVQSIVDSYDKSFGKSFVKYAKSKIAELYRISSKPPKWLQEPQWPVSSGGRPLLFVEQKKIHNEQQLCCDYVFIDEATGERIIVTQSIE